MKLLQLEADEPKVPAEGAAEPEELEVPRAAAPDETRDASAAVLRTPPDCSREDERELAVFLRYVLLLAEQLLGVALTRGAVERRGSRHHLLAADVLLAVAEELRERENGLTDERFVLEQLPSFFALVVGEPGQGRQLNCWIRLHGLLLGQKAVFVLQNRKSQPLTCLRLTS